MSNDQNYKQYDLEKQTIWNLFRIWCLRFDIYLEFGA